MNEQNLQLVELISKLPWVVRYLWLEHSELNYKKENRFWDPETKILSRQDLDQMRLEQFSEYHEYNLRGIFLKHTFKVTYNSFEEFWTDVTDSLRTQTFPNIATKFVFHRRLHIDDGTPYTYEQLNKEEYQSAMYAIRDGMREYAHNYIEELRPIDIDQNSLYDLVVNKNFGEYLTSPDDNIRFLASKLNG